MTGCAVREMDLERLDRRFPAVDLFLRPDQEPELVDRLGLASAQGPVGMPAWALAGRPGDRVRSARRRSSVGRPSASRTISPARAPPRSRGRGPPPLRGERLAADHLRLRQDLHLLHRPVQPRPGAQPAVRRDRRRGAASRRRASGRSRSSARTSTRTGTTSRRRRDSGTSAPSAGRAAASTWEAGRTSRSSSARSTASAPPTAPTRSRASGSSPRTRGTSRTG